MTDESRIARLTELARRAWPEGPTLMAGGDSAFLFKGDDMIHVALVQEHPRALDALEAALLVLVAGPAAVSLEGYQRDLLEAEARTKEWRQLADEHMQAKNELWLRTQAWVEQLAAKWEHDAGIELAHSTGPYRSGRAALYNECARELRERAKQP